MTNEGAPISQQKSDPSATSQHNKRYIRVRGGKMTTEDAKAYLAKREVPQLFECLMTGLMYHRPKDHIAYLRDCLDKIKSKGLDHVRWNLFIEQRRKTPLPPISPQNGSRPHSAQSYHSMHSSSRGSAKGETEMKSQAAPLPPIGGLKAAAQTAAKGDLPNVPFVFFMGGPGSGKGTQCKQLIERYPNWVHLSMGDLLRMEVSEKGTTDEKWGMVSDLLTKGDMAPEEVTIDLMLENLKKHTKAEGFIIEGYPRTMEQLQEYQNKVGRIDLVFLLDCEEYYLQSRLLSRFKDEGRIDDNLSAVASRISFFKDSTLPVVKVFDDDEKLVLVDGDRDEEEIAYELAVAFDSIFYNKGDGQPILPKAPPTQPRSPRPPSSPRSAGSRRSRPVSAMSTGSCPPVMQIDDIQVSVEDEGRKPDLPQCPIILIMGGPGSGKLTQCKRVVERYEGVVHLSMGDILRSEIVAKGTGEEKWNLVGDLVQKGEMAPEDVTVELLLSSLRQHADAKCIILEGYPRQGRQVEEFNKHVGGLNVAILLDCEEYYLKQRLINRLKESDRIDDSLNAIANRISFFKTNTLPVIKYYDELQKLVIINGDRDKDEVFFDMASLFDHMFFGVPLQNTSSGDAALEENIVPEQAVNLGGDDGNADYLEQLDKQGGQEVESVAQEANQDVTPPPRSPSNKSEKQSEAGSKRGSVGSIHEQSPQPESRHSSASKKSSRSNSPKQSRESSAGKKSDKHSSNHSSAHSSRHSSAKSGSRKGSAKSQGSGK